MAAYGKIQPVRASLPYQLLLYFNGYYCILFFLLEFCAFIWKGVVLPYPTVNLAVEIVLVFLLAILAAIYIYNGLKGNLSERVTEVLFSIALAAPLVAGSVYLLLFQTYVLTFEAIISVALLLFIALELIFAIVSIITFSRAP